MKDAISFNRAERLLKRQSEPAFIYTANAGYGSDEEGFFVCLESFISNVRANSENFKIVYRSGTYVNGFRPPGY